MFALLSGWGNGSIWPCGNAAVCKKLGSPWQPLPTGTKKKKKKTSTRLVVVQRSSQNPPGLFKVTAKSKLWESALIPRGGIRFWKFSYRNTELQLARSWVQSLLIITFK